MGVLVMDRCDDRPFTPHEQEVGAQAARFLMRAIRNERLFVQLERRKVEQGRLYRAVQALAGARSEEDVITAAATAAKDIANVDQVGITLFDEQTKTHVVCAVRSRRDELEPLLGCTFAHNTGLVSMAVENRFPLPYRGEFDAATQVVLTKRAPWPHVPSLLVLPLFTADRTLGTLVLGSRSRNAFHPQVRPTLEVLASHLAVSLAHARMLSELEAKATTDGLTGLLNKRAMTELAQQKLAAAERFQRPLSVLIVDADHFKRVNDTYGHDVGDLVLKGLGAILRQQKRATDVVARFGGEEFVALCEQTDEQGAVLLAERIREELARTTFATVHGAVRVTCSIGVATYPQGGRTWAELFKTADLNLYAAKRNGRNRTVADADAAPPGRAARKGATGRTPLAPSAQPKTQTRSAGTSGGRKGAQR
jgi:diguanylate cyclase (GGDEF)-like protein